MCQRHGFFFGFDQKLECYRSNLHFIEQHVEGNFIVICGHCGRGLCGARGYDGPSDEIIWRHDGKSWFGTFAFP